MVKKLVLIVLGIILIVLSYLQAFLPKNMINEGILGLSHVLFSLGSIFIFEAVTIYFYKKSLFKEIIRSKRNLIAFVVVSFIGGLGLEFIAHFLGKLWIFPYWNFTIYALLFIPGFALYWLAICESYLATKSIIDYIHTGKTKLGKPFKWENKFFMILAVFGIILLFLSVILIFFSYFNQSSSLMNIEDIYKKTSNYIVDYRIIIIFFFGLWFILEFVEYKEKKTSLIRDILHNNPIPLISIAIASTIFAFLMESQNIFHNFWEYINFPFENIKFLGFPIILFFFWILHYIFFLSLFRALTDKESSEIWKGDTIK